MPGGQSRWSAGKDLSWEPLRIERVCEVKYDHMQGDALPPRRGLPALAARQAAGGLPLRSARGHGALRAREGLRRQVDGSTPGPLVRHVVVGIERFLRRPQRPPGTCCRLTRMRVHVLKRPRIASTSTSAGCEVRRRLGMARLPALEAGERVVFLRRAADLDQRMLRVRRRLRRRRFAASTAARAAARPPASCSAAATARRPGLRAPAAPTARAARSSEHGCSSMPAWRSPTSREPRRHRRQREVGGVAVVDLVPGQRRRDARVRRRPHRVGAGDRAVLRVLVVVEEDAVALLLPPLARRERRRAPLDLARERQRGAAHLVEGPARARCARRRGCRASRTSSASRPGRDRRASRARPARRRGSAATRRPAPDRDRCAARRDDRDRRRAPDADAARGRRGSPSTAAPPRRAARPPRRCGPTESAARRPRSRRAATRARASGRRTRRRCRSDSAPARSAVRRRRAARRRRRRGSSARGRAWCDPACGNSTLPGFEIAISRPAAVRISRSAGFAIGVGSRSSRTSGTVRSRIVPNVTFEI